MIFTIVNIEAAIGHYLKLEPSRDYQLVSQPARTLADIYGAMIWKRQRAINASQLTAEQNSLLVAIPASVKEQS